MEPLRSRINGFIDDHSIAWELAFAFLAVIYVAVGVGLDSQAEPTPALAAIESVLTVVFVSEFALRFAAARDRTRYLRGHWIDLVALLPATRGLRIARLIRLLRLVRAFAGLYRAASQVERLADHRGLAKILIGWLAVVVTCCAALYLVERDVNPAIGSPFDALWWGIATMTTVGYGDIYPVTTEGRVAASAMMLLGIGLFSAITAIVTSYLLVDRSGVAPDPILTIERLAGLARDGTISQAEFDAKRIELLGRI